MDEKKLRELLADMTLEEKIEQLVQLHGGFFGAVEQLTGPEGDLHLAPGQAERVGSLPSLT